VEDSAFTDFTPIKINARGIGFIFLSRLHENEMKNTKSDRETLSRFDRRHVGNITSASDFLSLLTNMNWEY
jgi:hypothetical protein